jgi:PAS domain S-box-containing protein
LFNPGAERLFGYRADEVLRKDLGLLLPECYADAGAIFPGSTEMLRAMGSETRELVGRRKDGTTCDLELRVGETRIGGRTIFTGILHDIGERKRTQQMLHESEKLAASGRIAARIAHEINNPLAGIKNSFLLIKDAIAPDHPYFSYVARIESEIARIARVVRQMFDLYRPDQTTLREIDLSETIGDVVALLRTIAPERGVSFDVATSQVTGRVRLPEDSIRQVLYNIVINAIEASPVDGKVKIQAAIAHGMLTVLVTDQGPGIPDELRSQVYEPFFTTKAHLATGGLGLGLPISRGIVEAMRGTLEFASGANEGTAVRVRIPLPSHDPEQSHER